MHLVQTLIFNGIRGKRHREEEPVELKREVVLCV